MSHRSRSHFGFEKLSSTAVWWKNSVYAHEVHTDAAAAALFKVKIISKYYDNVDIDAATDMQKETRWKSTTKCWKTVWVCIVVIKMSIIWCEWRAYNSNSLEKLKSHTEPRDISCIKRLSLSCVCEIVSLSMNQTEFSSLTAPPNESLMIYDFNLLARERSSIVSFPLSKREKEREYT